MGMMFIATYYFWRFLKLGGWKHAAVAACVLGLSQISKYVAMFLLPIFLVIVIVRYTLLRRVESSPTPTRFGRDVTVFIKYTLLFVVVSTLIVNAAFLFNGSFTPLADYEFKSEQFKSMQEQLGALGRIPLPLPYPFLDGLDRGRFREETGRGYGNMYLLGELREIGGFKGYYVLAFILKVPLAVQALIVLAVANYVAKRKRYGFLRDELLLIAPIALLGLYFNLIFKIQIGIRHLLVIFPFVHVFCASPLKHWKEFGVRRKGLVLVLAGYLVVSVLSYFPHYIPYVNEVVWDRKQAYKYLADSNIDWGQGQKYFDAYLESHPDVFAKDRGRGLWFMKRYRQEHQEQLTRADFPDSGLIIVDVNHVVGIYNPERYRWLRESYEPIDHVAHCYLLFNLSP
jgi:hypothetical protein